MMKALITTKYERLVEEVDWVRMERMAYMCRMLGLRCKAKEKEEDLNKRNAYIDSEAETMEVVDDVGCS
ncbi:hypothetical protein CHS0354_040839 [Potamilus streckersoni]|uniref:Uncharacterized protein n=1 Tax=Potamilus streckersoni TaxID=2493646 RepID=A0AAE0VXC6_9BIVA|nr:hypothetical protein CHS0354_040839 [Potamilus streckersoni]